MVATAQPEPQSERAAVQLTRSEKEDLRFVSVADRITESSLLRDHTVAQIVERASELRRKLEDVA
jgi:hypothetical protein